MEIADAQKVKGLAPLACKTDKIDSTREPGTSPRSPPRRLGPQHLTPSGTGYPSFAEAARRA